MPDFNQGNGAGPVFLKSLLQPCKEYVMAFGITGCNQANQGRIMKDITPENYRICISVDLENFQFSGIVEIYLRAAHPVSEIRLNALELAFWSCRIKRDNTFIICPFSVLPGTEEVLITLPQPMTGPITLYMDYTGKINSQMAGFYRSRYTNRGISKYLAVTQFEESDARRAFPCFDHPQEKATFDIEMIIDDELTAISNMPIIEEVVWQEDKKKIAFQTTPKMSTYLVFFGVGEFEFASDELDDRVRAATTPGLKAHTDLGLDFGRKSLEFSEAYYGVKYPLPKLDLIGISDFAFGAMENWGAVTFRENLLLHFSRITSKPGKQRIFEVIAHEIAHQWFGNLVSPADWKYLWLNESFATYFGYKTVDNYYPEWEIWPQFINTQVNRALDRDALNSTFPIEIPGGEHVVINEATSPIIYSKGGGILRQVEGYIGKQHFQKGLSNYLSKHAYACTSSNHLWEAFESVTEAPIVKLMKSWIEQPGHPLIEVDRQGDKLTLLQRRFTYLPQSSDALWMIPITLKMFTGKKEQSPVREISLLMEHREMEIPVPSDAWAYKINSDQTGFFRVAYQDKGNLDRLGRLAGSKVLASIDRWGLQNDLYALLKKGNVSADEYLTFLDNYSQEDAFLPLVGIVQNLYQLYLIMKGRHKELIASTGKRLLEQALAKIGYTPEPEEAHITSITRDQILLSALMYGVEEAAHFAERKLRELLKGSFSHPDVMKSILQMGAFLGGQEIFDWLDNRFHASESEHERMNILTAFGSFKDKYFIEKAQTFILEKVPPRNKFIPISALGANPSALPFLWQWYITNLEELEQLHPIHYERVIAAIVPYGGLGNEEEVKSFFNDYLIRKESAKDVVRLSLEKLEINSAVVAREGARR